MYHPRFQQVLREKIGCMLAFLNQTIPRGGGGLAMMNHDVVLSSPLLRRRQ